MSSEKIEDGDVVYLKSGSPKMTVKFIEAGEACCNWFEKNKSVEGSFAVSSLTKINPNQSAPPFMSNPRR